MKQLISRLWQHLGARRRRQFIVLLALMLVASLSEIVSIGAVLPFLGVLTAPAGVFKNPAMQPVIHWLGITSVDQLLLPLTIAFCLAVLASGALRLLMMYASNRLSFATGADLSINVYRRTLYQPYSVHVARNSGEVINGIVVKVNTVIYSVILPSLTLISSAVMLVVVLVALLYVDPIIALSAMGGFGLIYAVIIRVTRKRLLNDSALIAHESNQVIKALQEGLGGIRDVLLDGSQDSYCQIYRTADAPLRRAQGRSQFIALSPRYAMEALGMLLIAVLAYVLARQPNGIEKAIPVLGALALGAQRLLPVLQQAYNAWSNIRSSQISLRDTLDLLDQPLPAYADKPVSGRIPFRQEIALNQLSFRYAEDAPWVLRDINLTIRRGERIGFIGTTGSGKSTLLDLVMGLLQPAQGGLTVDGVAVTETNRRAWQAHLAHVPQAIYLADSTIAENIAFGVPKEKISFERVKRAAVQAQIAQSIEGWPQQYETIVGERGVRLSGGQRQRIGIARALYKQADVIVFDEATSALDNETELAVMQAIEGLSADLTVLIIAHRLTTLKNCDRIVELNGSIRRIGSYAQIVEESNHGAAQFSDPPSTQAEVNASHAH